MVRAAFEEEDEIAGEGVFGLDPLHLVILTPRGTRDVYAQCALEDELGEATAIEGVGSGSAGSVGIAELLARNSEDLLAHAGYFSASRFDRRHVQGFDQFDRTRGHRFRGLRRKDQAVRINSSLLDDLMVKNNKINEPAILNSYAKSSDLLESLRTGCDDKLVAKLHKIAEALNLK